MPHANTEALNAHLAAISSCIAEGSHAALLLDGAGWHVALNLVVPENITLVHLPPYSPELNPVENVWQYLRQNKLALRVHETYDDIVEACCRAWNDLMAMPDRIATITTRQWATVS